MKTKIPVIAIFDIGKTNKKLLLFDERYNVVKEEVKHFDEIEDDDEFPSEDLDAIASWVLSQFDALKCSPVYQLKAVNFSTYGASLVHVDGYGKQLGYLYNYLKPYPENLRQQFCNDREPAPRFSMETCSPLWGHLNAGMQLYWIKNEKPSLFNRIVSVLHFPQYLCFLLTGKKFAEMTNVGCHSAMWNFEKMEYHSWLKEEQILPKLSAMTPGNHAVWVQNEFSGEKIMVGIGLHDSSAALIPYLNSFAKPFLILSTGTWSISLNPFNASLPDAEELMKGCLSYLSYQGNPVKTSMLFAGNDHYTQVQRIVGHFNVAPDFFKAVDADLEYIRRIADCRLADPLQKSSRIVSSTARSAFHLRELTGFRSPGEAYHQLVADIIDQQAIASDMVLRGSDVEHIYVDGGFCKNGLYMQLLANAFSNKQVHAASMIQGTALGAALAIHAQWNKEPVPADLIQLQHWPAAIHSPA